MSYELHRGVHQLVHVIFNVAFYDVSGYFFY